MPDLPKWVIPFIIGGNTADMASTEWARHGGAQEANPAMINRPVAYTLKTAATMGGILGARKLWQKGHKRAAVATALLAGGIPLAAALHNVRVGRHQ